MNLVQQRNLSVPWLKLYPKVRTQTVQPPASALLAATGGARAGGSNLAESASAQGKPTTTAGRAAPSLVASSRLFSKSITCWPKQQQEQRDSCSTGMLLAVYPLFGWSHLFPAVGTYSSYMAEV